MTRVGLEAFMGELRNTYRVLRGKPEGKRVLGRPKHGLDSYGSRQGKVVNTVMKIGVPNNAGSFVTSCGTMSFSRNTPIHRWNFIIS